MTTVDELIATGRLSQWHPMSKGDLLVEYPELQDNPALKLDNPKKLLFAWFYGHRCSRGMELHDDKDRIRYALLAAWGPRPPKEIAELYVEKRWGQAVQAAIDTMRGMNPGGRMAQKLIASQQIEKVKRILDANIDTLGTWEERLEFIKVAKAGTELIAQLLPLTEEKALGVVEKKEEDAAPDVSEIGNLLDELDS